MIEHYFSRTSVLTLYSYGIRSQPQQEPHWCEGVMILERSLEIRSGVALYGQFKRV
jgi:hypothetical protein